MEIRECNSHGFFEGDSCECGSEGDVLLPHDKKFTLSKLLTKILRHEPELFDVEIDENGWTHAYTLVAKLQEEYPDFTPKKLAAIVSLDDKGRYEVEGNKIRACYAHSIDVEINKTCDDVPETLYHGTPEDKVKSIMSEGLKPMNRQKVHLTNSLNEARNVGNRHSDNVQILEVETDRMEKDGFEFGVGGDNIFTVDEVPPEYIKLNLNPS